MVYIKEDVYREVIWLSKVLDVDSQVIINDWLKLAIEKTRNDPQFTSIIEKIEKQKNQKL